MIVFDRVTKMFKTQRAPKIIVKDASMILNDGNRVALLGRNGAGKSTFLRLTAGILSPDRGRITRTGNVSWPLGFAGSFHVALTGAQNVRFVARIYGRDTEELVAYVEEFAELGEYFHMPVQSYSTGMRARLAFGVSMGIAFDCYLVDEITAVGDKNFSRKARAVFTDRLSGADVIMASHSVATLREFCSSGIVLEGGKLYYYENLEDALAAHADNLERG